LLRKEQKTLGGYFILPHPVYAPATTNFAEICLCFTLIYSPTFI